MDAARPTNLTRPRPTPAPTSTGCCGRRAGDWPRASSCSGAYLCALRQRVYRLLGPDAEIDDVVQEAFLRAFEGLAGWPSRAPSGPGCRPSPCTWSIAGCAGAGCLRRLGFVPPGDGIDRHRGGGLAERVAGAGRGGARDLRVMLDRLPTEARVAFLLRRLEGMTVPEIAPHMRISERTVKRRIALAEQRLASIFENRHAVGVRARVATTMSGERSSCRAWCAPRRPPPEADATWRWLRRGPAGRAHGARRGGGCRRSRWLALAAAAAVAVAWHVGARPSRGAARGRDAVRERRQRGGAGAARRDPHGPGAAFARRHHQADRGADPGRPRPRLRALRGRAATARAGSSSTSTTSRCAWSARGSQVERVAGRRRRRRARRGVGRARRRRGAQPARRQRGAPADRGRAVLDADLAGAEWTATRARGGRAAPTAGRRREAAPGPAADATPARARPARRAHAHARAHAAHDKARVLLERAQELARRAHGRGRRLLRGGPGAPSGRRARRGWRRWSWAASGWTTSAIWRARSPASSGRRGWRRGPVHEDALARLVAGQRAARPARPTARAGARRLPLPLSGRHPRRERSRKPASRRVDAGGAAPAGRRSALALALPAGARARPGASVRSGADRPAVLAAPGTRRARSTAAPVCLRFEGPWSPRLAALVESDLRTAFGRRRVAVCAPTPGGRARRRPAADAGDRAGETLERVR